MRHGSLFSGIGGFDLAAEWMGWENVFHCEWNEFGQKVLKHYLPNAKSYGDMFNRSTKEKKMRSEGKIFNNDCLLTLRQMEAESIDLVVTSPPYDDMRNYQANRLQYLER